MKSLIKSRATLLRRNLIATFSAMLLSYMSFTAHVSAADFEQTTKNSGASVVNLIIAVVLVVAVIGIAFGILGVTTGISWLSQAGSKRILISCLAIFGILCLGMGVNWLFHAVTAGGGSTHFTYGW